MQEKIEKVLGLNDLVDDMAEFPQTKLMATD